MRSIYRLFLLFSFTVFTWSCSDLSYTVYDEVSPNNYPKSKEDVKAAVTGVYRNLMAGYFPDYLDNATFTLNELTTDELNTAWTGNWQLIDLFLWKPDHGYISNNYNMYTKAVTQATVLLDQLNSITIDDTEFLRRSKAEVRVMRALYAFTLYDLFGLVPVVTDPAIAKDLTTNHQLPRPSREEMIGFLTSELSEAVIDLPESYSSADDYGRVTKGAALTILMKVYLHEKDWNHVVEVSNEIRSLNQYSLLGEYIDVFDIKNENLANKELIMSIPKTTSDISMSHSWFAAVLPVTPQYRSKTGVSMAVWGGIKTPWSFYDKFEEGKDKRLTRLVRYYTSVNGESVDYRQVAHPRAIGAIPLKWSEDPAHLGSQQGSDIILYRYADVLLSRAEALNELKGINQESIDLVNEIRTRAGVSNISISDFTKETLRDFILDERGRELWGEGHRRQDLIRHGKYISTAQSQGISNAMDFHVLFPIPQSVINENPGIGQNPGY